MLIDNESLETWIFSRHNNDNTYLMKVRLK